MHSAVIFGVLLAGSVGQANSEDLETLRRYAQVRQEYFTQSDRGIRAKVSALRAIELLWTDRYRQQRASQRVVLGYRVPRAGMPTVEELFTVDGQFPVSIESIEIALTVLENVDTDLGEDLREKLENKVEAFIRETEDVSRKILERQTEPRDQTNFLGNLLEGDLESFGADLLAKGEDLAKTGFRNAQTALADYLPLGLAIASMRNISETIIAIRAVP